MSQSSDTLGLSQIFDSYGDLLNGDLCSHSYQEVKPLLDYVNSPTYNSAAENEVPENALDNAALEQSVFIDHVEQKSVNHLALPPPLPTHPRLLTNEEYPGPYNFEVDLDPNGTKNPWIYSVILRKIFIGPSTPFPVDFKFNDIGKIPGLWVRATPIFAQPQHSQELVLRCIAHSQKTDASNANVPSHVRDHVIRCLNSEAQYLGDRAKGVHLSVVVPLSQPQTGTESVREMYQFMCKNSCPSGMNRKPIEVLFTLEDSTFNILGRRVLEVRVCSCPKRDKEKEEKEFTKGKDAAPQGKKRKLDKCDKKVPQSGEVDTKEYLLQVPIVGKENLLKALTSCHDIMAGAMLKHGPPSEQLYKKCINNINVLISKNGGE